MIGDQIPPSATSHIAAVCYRVAARPSRTSCLIVPRTPKMKASITVRACAPVRDKDFEAYLSVPSKEIMTANAGVISVQEQIVNDTTSRKILTNNIPACQRGFWLGLALRRTRSGHPHA